jgi:YVTN family beta-propeller protein
MSPSTVPLARLTTLSLMFVLPLMTLPAQGAQIHTPAGGMMIASGHSNSNARQHGAGGRAPARWPGLHAHATTTYTINPAISLTPSAGPGGSSSAVSGRGFVLLVVAAVQAIVSRDASVGPLVRTVTVGRDPLTVAIAVHPGRIFVTNSGSNTVSVLDAHSGTVLRTIPVGRTPHRDRAPHGSLLDIHHPRCA